jgi:hypothetical protein
LPEEELVNLLGGADGGGGGERRRWGGACVGGRNGESRDWESSWMFGDWTDMIGSSLRLFSVIFIGRNWIDCSDAWNHKTTPLMKLACTNNSIIYSTVFAWYEVIMFACTSTHSVSLHSLLPYLYFT